MKTKFDVGEKVFVEAEVVGIRINEEGQIKYILDNPHWTNLEKFSEDDLISKKQIKE